MHPPLISCMRKYKDDHTNTWMADDVCISGIAIGIWVFDIKEHMNMHMNSHIVAFHKYL